jgi:hypothetical protein
MCSNYYVQFLGVACREAHVDVDDVACTGTGTGTNALVLASQVRAWCAQREIAVVDTTVLAALYRALCPTTAIESDRRKKCGSVRREAQRWQIWRTGDGDEHFTKDRRVGRYTQSSIIHF